MTKQMRKRRRVQVWMLFGYGAAAMSVLGLGSNDGMWRKLVLSLAVMVLATLLATLVSAREVGDCGAGPHEE